MSYARTGKINLATTGIAGGVFAVSREWRFQEAAGFPEVHGLPPSTGASLPNAPTAASAFLPHCRRIQAVHTVKDHAATAYRLEGGHAMVECSGCHISKGKDTPFKIKFQRSTDCDTDQPAGQFEAAPYFNGCERRRRDTNHRRSHRPNKETKFALTGGHVAVPRGDCHKESDIFKPQSTVAYHWNNQVLE